MSFPRWFFHQKLMPEGQIVKSDAELKLLGPGWVSSPTLFTTSQPIEEVVEVQGEPATIVRIPVFEIDKKEAAEKKSRQREK